MSVWLYAFALVLAGGTLLLMTGVLSAWWLALLAPMWLAGFAVHWINWEG